VTLLLLLNQAGGGSGELAGTAAITLTPTGPLTGSGELAGTVALTITVEDSSTPTPPRTVGRYTQLRGGILPGRLYGSFTRVVSGDISGTAAIGFTDAGTLLGGGVLLGSTAVTFTDAGTVTGSGGMTGSAGILITPTGTTLGAGALIGSAAMILTPTGSMPAAGDLIGNITLVFTPSAELLPTLPAPDVAWWARNYDAGTGTWTDIGTLGFHPSQATEADRPTLTASVFKGHPAVTFSATQNLTGSSMPLANSRTKGTLMVAFRSDATSPPGGAVFSTTQDQLGFLSDGRFPLNTAAGEVGTLPSPVAAAMRSTSGGQLITGIYDGTQAGNATRLRLWRNLVEETLTYSGTIPATTYAGGQNVYMGREAGGSGWAHKSAVVLFWRDVALTTAQRQAYEAHLSTLLFTKTTSQLVVLGDSNAVGSPSNVGNSWVERVTSLLGWETAFNGSAVGHKLSVAATAPPTDVRDDWHVLQPCLIALGTNDLAVDHASLATLQGDFNTLKAKLVAARYPIFAFTIPRAGSNITGADETTRAAYNAWLYTVGGVTVIDIDTALGDPTGAGDANFEGDDLHLSDDGHDVVAGLVQDAIEAMGVMAGSASMAFSNSALLSGIAPITGSSALTLTPTGAITGAGVLTGSAAMLITPTAATDGTAAILGTAAITLTPTGTLLGAGAVTGAAAILITPTGTLLGSGTLAGSTAMLFTPSGTTLGAGALAGAAAILFTPLGGLSGLGSSALSGAVAVTITPTSTLLGSAVLSGSTALTLTPAAILGGSTPATGTISLTFTTAGATTGAGRLAGSVGVDLGVSGTALGAGVLAGLSEINFSPAADLTGFRFAAGTAAMNFSPAATLIGIGNLEGVAGVTFTPLATIAASGALAGTAAVTFTNIGDPTSSADFDPETQVIIAFVSWAVPEVSFVSRVVDTINWVSRV
jgi:hypothetical protein